MSDPNSDDYPTDGSPGTDDGTADDEPAERVPSEVDSGTGAGDRDDRGRDPRGDSTQIANEERRRNTALVSAIVAAIGAWVALSVLLFEVGEASLWNNVLVGAVVFFAAGYNVYRLSNDIPLSVGIASLVAVLGIWLIVSSALLGMLGSLFWSTLVSGLLVAGLSGYNAYEAREARTVATEPETGV
ncbi:SPW repeat domain-containing protein [Natrarchaeobius oligotrophus]|uniref:SPW repeat-containing integral membrane domain-containing protein n=1 Tax=Natrarchaeobius chitinivorans TaxID=1679083 RepID=A0A3N6MEL8_NATCH|nr:hypothetical protein [Natrarchaeobius chitinivorans]RQH01278.1 hypothetical protein EA472_07440 [Natrarchaeobius chitinivorans]